MGLSLRHQAQTGSRILTDSYSVCARIHFAGSKVAGTWS